MASENVDVENTVEIIKDDEKWLIGCVKGKSDVYGARYRLKYVVDQTVDTVNENMGTIKFTRQWARQAQCMFPAFRYSVEANKEGTLEERYLKAFNSNKPTSKYYGNEVWGHLVNFMGPILDTAPRRDPYDYDSDEDVWGDYECHKQHSDYGCHKGCCDSNLNSISE